MELKDSGTRMAWSTGAKREEQTGKGAPSLVPNFIIWLTSRIYEDGKKKIWESQLGKGDGPKSVLRQC